MHPYCTRRTFPVEDVTLTGERSPRRYSRHLRPRTMAAVLPPPHVSPPASSVSPSPHLHQRADVYSSASAASRDVSRVSNLLYMINYVIVDPDQPTSTPSLPLPLTFPPATTSSHVSRPQRPPPIFPFAYCSRKRRRWAIPGEVGAVGGPNELSSRKEQPQQRTFVCCKPPLQLYKRPPSPSCTTTRSILQKRKW